jgi:hypothetical protein
MKRPVGVIAAYENVENKRNIDGKGSRLQGEFELVSVIDVCVEINRSRGLKNSIRSWHR